MVLICFIFIHQRLSFGYAHRLHLYSDYSILVSDFLANGTLQVGAYCPFTFNLNDTIPYLCLVLT